MAKSKGSSQTLITIWGFTMDFDWGCNYVIGQKSFQASKYVLEIGGGSFERVIALSERYPNKVFFSIDFFYSSRAVENVRRYAHLPNLNIIKGYATDKIFADNTFDFIFSIDVGEHIPQLASFICELYRILKTGGIYYFIQNPFWTSSKGHHYRHWEPDVQAILKGYKHIQYNQYEIIDFLSQFPSLPFDKVEAIKRIYQRTDLSRMSARETRTIYEASQLEIVNWQGLKDENFEPDKALIAVQKSDGRFLLEDFEEKAAIVTCIKLPPLAG